MSKIPAVLIVILNYGTYDLTINLIKQLHSNLNYQSYDIMVVDNPKPIQCRNPWIVQLLSARK